MEELDQPKTERPKVKPVLQVLSPFVIAGVILIGAILAVREWGGGRRDDGVTIVGGQVTQNTVNVQDGTQPTARPSPLPTPIPCAGPDSFARFEDAFATDAATVCALQLANKQLYEVPREISTLTRLQELDLRGNQLEEVPPDLLELTGLVKLNLAFNRLSRVPSEIGKLTKLTELQLYNNLLKEIPPEIGNVTDLRILYLHNNQLTDLPDSIANLIYLETLTLHNNNLDATTQRRIRDLLPHTDIEFQGPSEE